MVLLTIAISGGPFLGLLGTVVGVMITFAAIAAAGDVNINAIAPGISAALLATVAGLAVAIPALFGYNYLIIAHQERHRRTCRCSSTNSSRASPRLYSASRPQRRANSGVRAMQVQDEDKPYDDINITPMLDLAYVLLVIFIIMTTASVQGIKVDLPKASSTRQPGQAEDQGDHRSTTTARSSSTPIR